MPAMISAAGIVRPTAIKLGASFVHSHYASIQRRSIQRSYSSLGFRRLRHLDECDAARLAGIPILYDLNGFDHSMSREDISQCLLCHRNIEVPNKNVSHDRR